MRLLICALLFCGAVRVRAATEQVLTLGFQTNRNVFPIAVWLQSPANAERFKAAGINLYVGLWRGPTDEQRQQLKAAGIALICGQSKNALEHKDDPLIVAWMHGDEPDNAQSLGRGEGYGPPIKPEVIQADYSKMREADPSRPVLLNLGQGVAWDNYIGRGVRRNHPEDYSEYIKGCDIASFDIYPVVHENKEITGKLEYVARGVERLRQWSGGKPTWNCIECTHISNTNAVANPDQIRAEVWMSIIHGSRGLIYFVHQFKPVFREAALLDEPENLAAVTKINAEVQSLALIINSPEPAERIRVNSAVPVATTFREFAGTNYLFAVCMRNEKTHAAFRSSDISGRIEVLGEGRSVSSTGESFSDEFRPYAVHLYRWLNAK